jgi:hypothetical protein
MPLHYLLFNSVFQLSAGLLVFVYKRLWLKEVLSVCFQPSFKKKLQAGENEIKTSPPASG